jgi:hypothetical protein
MWCVYYLLAEIVDAFEVFFYFIFMKIKSPPYNMFLLTFPQLQDDRNKEYAVATQHRVFILTSINFSISLFLKAHSVLRLHSISKVIAPSKRKRIEFSFLIFCFLMKHSVKPAEWIKVPI